MANAAKIGKARKNLVSFIVIPLSTIDGILARTWGAILAKC